MGQAFHPRRTTSELNASRTREEAWDSAMAESKSQNLVVILCVAKDL
jgi:hypothetical protein